MRAPETYDVEAFALLSSAVARATGGKAEVARRVGVSRTSVSLYLSGQYPGGVTKIEKRIIQKLREAVHCPHLQEEISASDCATYSGRTIQTHSPAALAFWRSCQRCAFNTKTQGQSNAIAKNT